MKKNVTQKMVAEAAGVSQMSVALVLGNAAKSPDAQKRVGEATRQRILRAAEQLGYRPSRQAQMLRGGRSGLVGLLKAISYHETNIRLIQAAGAAIQKHDYRLVTAEIISDSGELSQNLDMMLDLRVEGLLLEGGITPYARREERFQAAFRQRGIPVVYLHCPATFETSGYAVDHPTGMAALVEHLAANGYRTFAYVSLIDETSRSDADLSRWIDAERLAGFRQGLRRAGIAQADAEVVHASKKLLHKPDYELGHDTATSLLRRKRLPDVIMAHTDPVALGVIGALRQAGIDVPGSIGVTGFDNTNVGRYSNIPVTTVGYDTEAMAEAAVTRLVDLIEGRTTTAQPSVAFSCQVVPRRSTRLRRDAE